MSDDADPKGVINRSGGADLNAQGDISVGGDTVGRDKIESAGGHIVHAEAGATVVISDRPAATPVDLSPAPGEPPFKGLQFFDVADAELFFGRERLTAKLVGLLREQHFLAIVGASGSGKSSVARAGVVAALKRGDPLADGTLPPAGSRRWLVHIITPTTHPLEAMAASLTQNSESVTATTTLMDDLARDPRSLHLAVRRALSHTAADYLLLVVDQFEELFTQCRSDVERKAFVDNLMTATALETAGPTIVVLTLRADFYAHCAQFDNLREALERWQAYIGPMGAAELHCAIEEPARRGGWEFEEGLVELMLRDLGDEPGALPLLSHALLETWKRRQGHALTLAGYVEVGGVHGAIARTAESVFSQLKPEQQAIARNIFVRLTELGEGTQDTRRRAVLSELLTQPGDRQSIKAVLATLIDARLVMTEKDTVEVAHEALIREWPRLRTWLAEDRAGLRVQRQLTEDARDWVALQRDPGALYRGARLETVLEWAQDYPDQINVLEQEFLEASCAQRASELDAAKQQAARLRHLAVYLAGAFGLALLLAIVATFFGVRAEQQARLSRSRELAAVAFGQIARDPERGLLIALEAAQLADTYEVQDALRQLLRASSLKVILRGHDGVVSTAKFSPSGQYVVTASEDKTARVWGEATGQEVAVLRGHEGPVNTAEFSPDGQRIVTASGDQTARVWETKTGEELAVLRGHVGPINSAEFSSDGQHIVTASSDKTARVWDAVTGQELAVLSGHRDLVNKARFSPDGQLVVTASYDGTARVWSAVTGQELVVLRGHVGLVNDAGFSPDGQRVVTGGSDRTARVWSAETGQSLVELSGHEEALTSAQFSPDGQRIVTTSGDQTAQVWSAITWKKIVVLRGHEGTVLGAEFSPDGQRIITVGWDETARVWDATTGKWISVLRGHDGVVLGADFSPDGQRVVTASSDHTARVWGAETGAEIATLRGNVGPIISVEFSPDGRRVVTAGSDQAARVWDTETGQELTVLRGHGGPINSAEYSTDGQRIVTASSDKTARVWDAVTGQELVVLSGHGGMVLDAEFSANGQQVVTSSADGTARVWDAGSGQALAVLRGHIGTVFGAQFSPDGQRIVTVGGDQSVRLWEATTGQPLAVLHGHEGIVTSVEFSRDGQHIVTSSYDRTARVWDATTGQPTATLRGHENWVTSAWFSPDGRHIVTVSEDGTARVWVTATGQEVAVLRGHEGVVNSAQFSPDGRRIVTSSSDRTAREWDAATAQEVAVLYGHDEGVTDAEFSPDGQRIVTVGVDGTGRVYAVQLNDLVTLARARVTRELSCNERKQYLYADIVCTTPTPGATGTP